MKLCLLTVPYLSILLFTLHRADVRPLTSIRQFPLAVEEIVAQKVELLPYIIAQVLGAILAAGVLYVIAAVGRV